MGLWTAAKAPRSDIERLENALRKILSDNGFTDRNRIAAEEAIDRIA